MARETALLLALGQEAEAAAVILGWQRALIQATGALEDEPEVEVIARTMELIYAALPVNEADAALARGGASGDEKITQLALAAVQRLSDSVRPSEPS
jgi:hypothetical protein